MQIADMLPISFIIVLSDLFYIRCFFILLQGVKESLTEREGGLEELREAGQSLEAVVRAEVGERLRAEVREEEAAWARAEAGLGELATSYRKAAALWARYREALSAADLPPLVSSLTLEVSLSELIISS